MLQLGVRLLSDWKVSEIAGVGNGVMGQCLTTQFQQVM